MRPLVTLGNIAYLYVMKHLTALLAAVITFAASAQQMPYNPDVNADAIIGVDDVLGVLGLYDTALMQPDLECDYEGTELEQLFIGLAEGSLLLDSVYVEYLLYDTIQYYTPGCPDVVNDPVILERSYMCDQISGTQAYTSLFGYNRTVGFTYDYSTNTFSFFLNEQEVQSSTSFGNTSYLTAVENIDPDYDDCFGSGFSLPFPESLSLSENGIEGHFCWWGGAAEYLKVIPFWHEAE